MVGVLCEAQREVRAAPRSLAPRGAVPLMVTDEPPVEREGVEPLAEATGLQPVVATTPQSRSERRASTNGEGRLWEPRAAFAGWRSCENALARTALPFVARLRCSRAAEPREAADVGTRFPRRAPEQRVARALGAPDMGAITVSVARRRGHGGFRGGLSVENDDEHRRGALGDDVGGCLSRTTLEDGRRSRARDRESRPRIGTQKRERPLPDGERPREGRRTRKAAPQLLPGLERPHNTTTPLSRTSSPRFGAELSRCSMLHCSAPICSVRYGCVGCW